MTRAARNLGLSALIALMLGFGASWLWMRLAVEAPRLVQREDVAPVLATLDERHADVFAVSSGFVEANRRHSRIVQAHAHFLNLAVLMLVIAVLLNRSISSDVRRSRLALLLGFGVIAYPAGLLADGTGSSALGHVLALLGSLSIVAVVLLIVLDRARAARDSNDA